MAPSDTKQGNYPDNLDNEKTAGIHKSDIKF